MDIAKIKNNLRFATPTELYDIAPGQVVYFVSKDGLKQRELYILAELLRYLRQLHKDNAGHYPQNRFRQWLFYW